MNKDAEMKQSSWDLQTSPNKPWRKVLYEKQPYPDNYTDEKMFLRDLKKNIDIKEITFLEAVAGASLLLQEFCNVVAFVLIYFYILYEWIDPFVILVSMGISTVLGFIYYRFFLSNSVENRIGSDLRTLITFIVFGRLFSPVFHTLTDTISTDTIYTMTFVMMLVHLIFFDYGVGAAIVSSSLSVSAVVFCSICLASRLSSANNAFILITTAVVMFVLFPVLRTEMNNPNSFKVLFLLLNTYFLYHVSIFATILFLLVVILICIIFPLLYVHYQKYKENIYGPWDEAIVDDADSIICNSNSIFQHSADDLR
ncbi:unnamed protein product [Phaedon cochleariae]|uniref:Phosphatidylinositol N-acetylglucosaminyltransferase subunit C n=1 Tax=Phaedon cochleariae TaxID=80249 RepID=A0A9P0DUT2_PHACE|nr:unnamed protein product [Phaedon cochleariae]